MSSPVPVLQTARWVLSVSRGETEFDKNYQFNIFAAADGYRFRKAFHISGSKFLLEFYLDKNKYGNMDASGKMAVVDMDAKTLTWVSGLPDASTVSFGWGDGDRKSTRLNSSHAVRSRMPSSA